MLQPFPLPSIGASLIFNDTHLKTLALALTLIPIMATDSHDARRRHRRSTFPEDAERSSKRHKHRHHSHRHRHGSKKRDEDTEYDGGTVARVPSPAPVPNPAPYSSLPDDDVEEGEILEEGEIGKKHTESDAEPGEIEVTGDRDVRSDNKNPVCYDRIIYLFIYLFFNLAFFFFFNIVVTSVWLLRKQRPLEWISKKLLHS